MDPINGLGPAGPVTALAAQNRKRGAAFAMAEDAAVDPSGGVADTEEVAAASLVGLLALQEDRDGGHVRDRDARRRGRDLLGELAAQQRDLLAGPPDRSRLGRLADLAGSVPVAADPRLRDAVNAIALRARVEAARYGAA